MGVGWRFVIFSTSYSASLATGSLPCTDRSARYSALVMRVLVTTPLSPSSVNAPPMRRKNSARSGDANMRGRPTA